MFVLNFIFALKSKRLDSNPLTLQLSQVITNNSINGSLEPDVMFSVLEALLGGTGEEKSGAMVQAVGLLKEDVVTSENSYDLLDAILQCTEEPDVS